MRKNKNESVNILFLRVLCCHLQVAISNKDFRTQLTSQLFLKLLGWPWVHVSNNMILTSLLSQIKQLVKIWTAHILAISHPGRSFTYHQLTQTEWNPARFPRHTSHTQRCRSWQPPPRPCHRDGEGFWAAGPHSLSVLTKFRADQSPLKGQCWSPKPHCLPHRMTVFGGKAWESGFNAPVRLSLLQWAGVLQPHSTFMGWEAKGAVHCLDFGCPAHGTVVKHISAV